MRFILLASFALIACSSGGAQGNAGGSAGSVAATGGTANGGSGNAATGGSATTGGAGGGCSVVVESHTPDAGIHVTECSHIDYSTNPPCSGMHYPVWCAYQSYDFPMPRGYWVHGLEHGAVVITYNCPGGCADEVAHVQAMIDGLPADPRCTAAGLTHQIILTPDPLLDTRWAMSSWGSTLRATCVDTAAFGQFYTDHFGHAPEDTCSNGTAFTETTLTPGCGQ